MDTEPLSPTIDKDSQVETKTRKDFPPPSLPVEIGVDQIGIGPTIKRESGYSVSFRVEGAKDTKGMLVPTSLIATESNPIIVDPDDRSLDLPNKNIFTFEEGKLTRESSRIVNSKGEVLRDSSTIIVTDKEVIIDGTVVDGQMGRVWRNIVVDDANRVKNEASTAYQAKQKAKT